MTALWRWLRLLLAVYISLWAGYKLLGLRGYELICCSFGVTVVLSWVLRSHKIQRSPYAPEWGPTLKK
jgi:hypothetical protein